MSAQDSDLDSFIRLVEEVIGAAPITADSNFFLAGGDSLYGMQLIALLEERWNRQIDLVAFLAAESLREMYEVIVNVGDERTTPV